ncbi:7TM diverse intracellular signaling domain-containing protein [Polaribacter sp.]
MMPIDLKTFFELNPLAIFSVFIMGVLIIILLQNIFLYSSYKDKAYLWYSIYALIILLDQIIINYSIYYSSIHNENLVNFSLPIHPALEWLYNSAYLIFVTEFGGLFLFKTKTAERIKSIVKYLAFLLLFLFVYDVVFNTYLVRISFLVLFVPVLIALSIYTYFFLFKMKTAVKYYIILGSLAFSIFSILALVISIASNKNVYYSWSYFYAGVFIENIFFSIGLVIKQRLIFK